MDHELESVLRDLRKKAAPDASDLGLLRRQEVAAYFTAAFVLLLGVKGAIVLQRSTLSLAVAISVVFLAAIGALVAYRRGRRFTGHRKAFEKTLPVAASDS